MSGSRSSFLTEPWPTVRSRVGVVEVVAGARDDPC